MFKVLAADGMSPEGIAVFGKYADLEIEVRKSVAADELLTIIADYDALIVRSATKATAEVIETAVKLKAIGRAGVGVDNIDLAASSARNIPVMNTPEANTISTAEHAISLIFALAHRVAEADATMKKGLWAKKKLDCVELAGKNLGIIGFGRIGRYVANVCRAAGMNVLASDPMVSAEDMAAENVKSVTLDELFQKADFITVHAPVNEHTRNMICSETIAKMKKGVRMVNCARGGIINEDDLCDAIESGQVAGAALDVYPKEPNQNERLLKYSQIILTPHIAASTGEAQAKVGIEVATAICDFLTSGKVTNAVNAAALNTK